eukprot:3568428-Rhodomonas_salina.2
MECRDWDSVHGTDIGYSATRCAVGRGTELATAHGSTQHAVLSSGMVLPGARYCAILTSCIVLRNTRSAMLLPGARSHARAYRPTTPLPVPLHHRSHPTLSQYCVSPGSGTELAYGAMRRALLRYAMADTLERAELVPYAVLPYPMALSSYGY